MLVGKWWQDLSLLKKCAIVALGICVLEQILACFLLPVDGHDSSSHLQWITFFRYSIGHGWLYPRWIPDGFFGFGAPIFYYYPPLTYYIAAVISFVIQSTNPTLLFYLTGSLATLLSVVGCYYLCLRLSLSKEQSFLAAMIYGFAPYRFLDLFIRNALSELVAMSFIPFLFLGMEIILSADSRRIRIRGIVLTALAWAAIMFTNLPVVAMCALAVPCYLLFRIPRQQRRALFDIAVGFALGTCVSAIYLVPMLHFYPLLNTSTLLGAAHVGSGNVLLDLLSGKSLSVGVYCSLMLAALLLLWAAPRFKRWTPERAFRAVLILVLVLQVPYVFAPLFERIPPFSIIQAPWRLDVILALAAAVLCAVRWGSPKSTGADWMLALWFIPSVILTVFVLFHVQINPHRAPDYAGTNEEYLPKSTAVRLSHSMVEQHASDPLIMSDDSALDVSSGKKDGEGIVIKFYAQHDSKATLHLFYWPEWRANLDGRALPISEDSLGRVVATVPSGSHEIRLPINRPGDSELIGRYLSLAGLLALVILALSTLSSKRVAT